jgi:hypothetical protein
MDCISALNGQETLNFMLKLKLNRLALTVFTVITGNIIFSNGINAAVLAKNATSPKQTSLTKQPSLAKQASLTKQASSTSQANTINSTSVTNNATSCYDYPPWSLGITALYLQPSFGGNGLGYSSFSNYSGNDDNGRFVGISGASNHINNINPKRAWGFQLNGAYRFNLTNELEIEWYHLNENVNGYLPNGSVFSGNYDGFYAGHLKFREQWNAVNLEVAHSILLDENKTVKLHAGLAFANIKNKFINYPQLFRTGNALFVTTETLSYNGLGPRMGADFNYIFGRGLNLYAKAAASLLLGKNKQDVSGFQNYTNSVYGFQPYGTPNYSQSNTNVVVTELEAKLGIKYDYQIAQNNKLSFDIGYLWMSYLNAINSYTDIGIVGTASGASIGTHTTANFDLSGLYFGLVWDV